MICWLIPTINWIVISTLLLYNVSMNNHISISVRELQTEIWYKRHELGINNFDPVDLFDPRIAAKVLGWDLEEVPSIPDWPPNKRMRIAGMVDPQRKLISISQEIDSPVRRFTAAHEIGHIILHKPQHLLRERPIKGPRKSIQDVKEREADSFAALFLMPERLVKKRFEATFGVKLPINITDDIAFWLDPNDAENLLREGLYSMGPKFALAKCSTNFSGIPIVPIHKQFKVSIEAMANRIDELGVIRG